MISPENALDAVLEGCAPVGTESVHLSGALNRILAEDIRSPDDFPPVALSSRDGYAFSSSATLRAGLEGHIALTISGRRRAGDPPGQPLQPDQAVRIFTGAPLPPGADTVLMQEDARLEHGMLVFSDPVKPGVWVRPRGVDCRRGDLLTPCGTRLRPGHLGMFASIGRTVLPVFRRPVVAFLVNGDEVVDPGTLPVPPGKVRNSNHFSMLGAIEEAGAVPLYLGCVRDDYDSLSRTVRAAPHCDVLITIGGASVGDYDYVLGVFNDLGLDVRFSRIALKPGKPTIYARSGERHFFGLPGNPVSCIVVFQLFVRPLLLKLSGALRIHKPVGEALLATDESKEKARRYYWPGRIEAGADNRPRAFLSRHRESSSLASLIDSNVLVVLPEGTDLLRAGSKVSVVHLDRDEV